MSDQLSLLMHERAGGQGAHAGRTKHEGGTPDGLDRDGYPRPLGVKLVKDFLSDRWHLRRGTSPTADEVWTLSCENHIIRMGP